MVMMKLRTVAWELEVSSGSSGCNTDDCASDPLKGTRVNHNPHTIRRRQSGLNCGIYADHNLLIKTPFLNKMGHNQPRSAEERDCS